MPPPPTKTQNANVTHILPGTGCASVWWPFTRTRPKAMRQERSGITHALHTDSNIRLSNNTPRCRAIRDEDHSMRQRPRRTIEVTTIRKVPRPNPSTYGLKAYLCWVQPLQRHHDHHADIWKGSSPH
ncbi:hypothetical protein HKD37_13G035741 [Glycine soja]|nr:hypothetical protein GmHk_13G036587 [Glycine max]